MNTRSFRRIESEDNRLYKQLVQTLSGRGVRKHDAAIVSGAKIIADLLRTSPDLAQAWISTPKQSPPPPELPERAAWYQIAPSLFRTLDVAGTDAPLLLVATPEMPAWDPEQLARGCTLLVPFQDPENVGAVIRSAVAFGVSEIVLLAEAAHPYHPKVLRASGGAVFLATLRRGPSIAELPDALPIVALSSEGAGVSTFAFPDRFALLPGVEGPGLPERFRAHALSIPMSERIESLNAATAAAIALYVWSETRRETRR
jgi:tRNA G18 (ribose-2'-O)-methylase SpoU